MVYQRYRIQKMAVNSPIVGKVHVDYLVVDKDNHDVVVLASSYPKINKNGFDHPVHYYYSFKDQRWCYGAHQVYSEQTYDERGNLNPKRDERPIPDEQAYYFAYATHNLDGEFHGLFVQRFMTAILNDQLSSDQMTKGLKAHLPYIEEAFHNYLGYWNIKYKTKANGERTVTPAQLMLYTMKDDKPID